MSAKISLSSLLIRKVSFTPFLKNYEILLFLENMKNIKMYSFRKLPLFKLFEKVERNCLLFD